MVQAKVQQVNCIKSHVNEHDASMFLYENKFII